MPYSNLHSVTVWPFGLTFPFSIAEVDATSLAACVSTLGALVSNDTSWALAVLTLFVAQTLKW